MPDNIKNCPFCDNADPYWDEMKIDDYMVNFLCCPECGCQGPYSKKVEEAARNWNKRAV